MTSLTAGQIPCCLCGVMILPNAANQCSTCLAQSINLEERLQQGPGGAPFTTIHQCRQCRRFMRDEKHYQPAEPESSELLALCLRHIPVLHSHVEPRIRLVDANWIWTEPHSMRWKLLLTVRAEIESVLVQQRCKVELVNRWRMCAECNREYTNRTWHAVVQLRQRRDDHAPKRGLTILEHALARNEAIRKHVLRMDTSKHGFDFYFLSLPEAQAFANFCARLSPMRIKTTRKMVSSDVKNNTANMQYTVAADMVPLCRDDLVLIDKSANVRLAGQLVLVDKVSSILHLVSAAPLRTTAADSIMELSPEPYYRSEKLYRLVLNATRLVRFVVIDVELCDGSSVESKYRGSQSGVEKYALADVVVAREADFGHNDSTLTAVTHLGHLVGIGDIVLGYDLASSSLAGDWEVEQSLSAGFVMPDVVLVKKVAGDADAGDTNTGEKPIMTKKKERRRRRKEGKKMKELEHSAIRMGFFDDEHEPDVDNDSMSHNPHLAAELEALERQFAALDAQDESQIPDEVDGSMAP